MLFLSKTLFFFQNYIFNLIFLVFTVCCVIILHCPFGIIKDIDGLENMTDVQHSDTVFFVGWHQAKLLEDLIFECKKIFQTSNAKRRRPSSRLLLSKRSIMINEQLHKSAVPTFINLWNIKISQSSLFVIKHMAQTLQFKTVVSGKVLLTGFTLIFWSIRSKIESEL